ncbi:hypothetical protein BDD43_4431 [Mucilaginibacter gracilis]|uniref:Uncharacterized protein n=1 Tax=Mucilaginibacter gracilis TaxID=423350 RepID=A0A495J755_9SPHI|nr:hypothetical protein [Mucilaginibacter gracilis]RKR84204.1 hypothetical protein BDD43_4431 [Mucilaginibacter gracilis]
MNGTLNYTKWIAVLTFIVSVIGMMIAWRSCSNAEDKDRAEMIEKTKIVACQVGQVMQFMESVTKLEKGDERFNKELEELQKIDPKGVDSELLDYVIRVRGYFKSAQGIRNSDGIEKSEKLKMIQGLKTEYHNLLNEFDKLKIALNIKYNFSLHC